MKNKVTLVYDGEQHAEVFLNGKHITYADYDQHGWSGLELVTDLVYGFVNALDLELEVIDQDCECEDEEE